MPAKGDNEPLHEVLGSTGQKNQVIKDFVRKLLKRRSAPMAGSATRTSS